MAKGILLIPLVIALMAGLGVGLCLAVGWPIRPQAIVVSSVIALIAAETALLPMNLARGSDAGQMVMIGLASTVVHMLLGMILIALALVAGLFQPTLSYAWWALAFYWASLIVVVALTLTQIREAERRGSMADANRPVSR